MAYVIQEVRLDDHLALESLNLFMNQKLIKAAYILTFVCCW